MPNPQTYFKESNLQLYELYKEIGFRFAKWYSLNFEKYIKKDFHNDYEDIWNEKFNLYRFKCCRRESCKY